MSSCYIRISGRQAAPYSSCSLRSHQNFPWVVQRHTFSQAMICSGGCVNYVTGVVPMSQDRLQLTGTAGQTDEQKYVLICCASKNCGRLLFCPKILAKNNVIIHVFLEKLMSSVMLPKKVMFHFMFLKKCLLYWEKIMWSFFSLPKMLWKLSKDKLCYVKWVVPIMFRGLSQCHRKGYS